MIPDKNNLLARLCDKNGENCGDECDAAVCGSYSEWTEWSDCTKLGFELKNSISWCFTSM